MATKKASKTTRAKAKPVAKRPQAKPVAKRAKAKPVAKRAKPKPVAKPAKAKRAVKKSVVAKAASPAKTAKRAAPKAKGAAVRSHRAVPKVSPLRGTSVTDWVARLPKEQTAIVETLLTLAKSAAPDASIVIKWAQPVLELSGPFAYIKAAKGHVTLGFWRGTELDDPRGLLAGGDRMKHVRLASLEDVDRASLSAWITEAARLNREHGDPTKR